VISTEQHLRPEQVSAWVDDEATGSQATALQQHLATCHACSLRVLSTFELKRATAQVGRRFEPSPAMLARLTATVQDSTRPAPLYASRSGAWSALAACLFLVIGVAVWRVQRRPEPLAAELLDQHLQSLSATALPQVLSEDRHTVKPWFQGKLAFSFNLPEPADLPAGTTLRGANLAYLHGQPAAVLFFTMRNHQVSAFLSQRDRGATGIARSSSVSTRLGFTIESQDADYLTVTGVGDVSPADLHKLVSTLVQAQVPVAAVGAKH
jgi:anti-sigma factor RsiW